MIKVHSFYSFYFRWQFYGILINKILESFVDLVWNGAKSHMVTGTFSKVVGLTFALFA